MYFMIIINKNMLHSKLCTIRNGHTGLHDFLVENYFLEIVRTVLNDLYLLLGPRHHIKLSSTQTTRRRFHC